MEKRFFILFLFILLVISSIFRDYIKQQKKDVPSHQTTPSSLLPETHFNIDGKDYYTVTKVVDGDTIQVIIDGKKATIRLIGVDTPEVLDPRKKVQCFGKQASEFTKEKLTTKKVFLQDDITQTNRDKYNRLLRYVFLEGGTNFNKLLIQLGYAYEYTYDMPYQYQAEFKEAEKEAMANNRGLWGSCNK